MTLVVGILLLFCALRATMAGSAPLPWEEFKELEAAMRAPYDHHDGQELRDAVLDARFEALLAPYADGRARDDFWVAVLSARFNRRGNWADYLEVAAHLAAQAPSSSSHASRFTSFVRERVTQDNFADCPESAPWIEHVQLAAEVTSSPAERAWFAVAAAVMQCEALRAATIASADPAEIARLREAVQLRWLAAQAATRETRWAAVVQAASFLAQLPGESTDASTADELRTDLARLIRTLRDTPSSPENEAAIAMLEGLASAESQPAIALTTARTYAPGADMAFSYDVRGAREVRFELFRFSDDEWVRTELRNFWGEKAAAREPNETWSVPLSHGNRGEWFSIPGRLPDGLEPGFYVLRATADPPSVFQARAEFLVTTTDATVLVTTSGASAAYLHDLNSGAPIADVPVRGTWSANIQTFVAWEGTTDAEGQIVGLPHEIIPRANDYQMGEQAWVNLNARSFHVAVVTPSGPAQLRWSAENRRPDTADLDLILERTLFRPGEVVRWQAIARDRADHRLVVPPADSSFHLWVQGPDGVTQEYDYALDDAGMAAGEFSLPTSWDQASRPDGWTYVWITAARNRADGERAWSARRLILIETPAPNPPIAQIEITGEPARQRPGGVLQASVHVRNADGTPIAGAKIDFSFVCTASRAAPGTTATAFAEWKRQIAAQPMPVSTNAAGEATARLALPAFLLDATWIRIHATVRLQGGGNLRLVAAAPVAAHNTLAWADRPLAVSTPNPGEPTACAWTVVDAAGKPKSTRGEVWLYERRPAEPTLQSGTQDSTAATVVETLVDKRRVRAGKDGTVRVRIAPPYPGAFSARLVVDGHTIIDDCENPERAFASIRSLDAAAMASALAEDARPVASPPSAYRLDAPTQAVPGQPLSFGITAPENERLCWLTVVSEDRATIHRVPLTTPQVQLNVDDPPPARASLWASLLDADGVVRSKVEIPVQRVTASLVIEPVASTKAAKQAIRKTIRIRVREANGAPLPARVSIRVTDDKESPPDRNLWPPELEFEKDAAPVDVQLIRTTPPPAMVATAPKDSWRAMFADRATSALQHLSWAQDEERGPHLPSPFPIGRADPERLRLTPFWAPVSIASLRGGSLFAGHHQRTDNQTEAAAKSRLATTLLWAPNLATDDHGEVVFEFSLPRGVRHWRIDALAAGLDGETFARATHLGNRRSK